jgi:secreted PhoX family phosphatase
MERRDFLRLGAATAGALAFGPDFWRRAYADPATPGPGPYGSLAGRVADANGIVLPEGFTARVLGRNGEVVAGTDHEWHALPDGGATFAHDDGGWTYVSNSEVPAGGGGVGALRFDADGEVVGATRILADTSTNCAGGPTPWGTWLSCEEIAEGRVWECDPTGERPAEVRPALGTFKHEAVAVDPDDERLYLTEDEPDGRFYRFTPAAYPSLDEGLLEVAVVADDLGVTWSEVPEPTDITTPTRAQVPESTAFDGGEGIWFDSGVVYFTTKGDNVVRGYHVADARMEVVYDAGVLDDPPLTGVDNVTVAPNGDLFVCEDGGDMQLVLITPDRVVAPFLQVLGDDDSELAGCAFDPAGQRLYISSQRGGGGGGITYEVSGPFREGPPPSRPTTTLAAVAGGGDGDGDGGSDLAVPLAVGGAGVGVAALGALAWRARRTPATPGDRSA